MHLYGSLHTVAQLQSVRALLLRYAQLILNAFLYLLWSVLILCRANRYTYGLYRCLAVVMSQDHARKLGTFLNYRKAAYYNSYVI